MSGFRCTKCQDRGWRYDDDPALDFGGPLTYEISCECIAHKPQKEQERIVREAREARRKGEGQ